MDLFARPVFPSRSIGPVKYRIERSPYRCTVEVSSTSLAYAVSLHGLHTWSAGYYFEVNRPADLAPWNSEVWLRLRWIVAQSQLRAALPKIADQEPHGIFHEVLEEEELRRMARQPQIHARVELVARSEDAVDVVSMHTDPVSCVKHYD